MLAMSSILLTYSTDRSETRDSPVRGRTDQPGSCSLLFQGCKPIKSCVKSQARTDFHMNPFCFGGFGTISEKTMQLSMSSIV